MIATAVVVVLAVAGAFLLWRPQKAGVAEPGRPKRVAVLPFENLGSPQDDYFADGIADAVRGKLTSLPGVQVIARGSSTPYKKTTKTPKQIAQELDVEYLLTATVRWQKGTGGASRVEVSPELVEVSGSGAPTSKWQQPFDAALTDVFQVQADIASRVAQGLGVALEAGDQKRLSEKPTQNLAAYEAFLRGEEVFSVATDAAAIRKALAFYEQAVALDPGFAQAWARVSEANSPLSEGGTQSGPAERAREAAKRALELAPDRPEAYHALGDYQLRVALDSNRAIEQYARGLRLAPDNAELLTETATAELPLGRWDAAVEHLRRAERLDPRSVWPRKGLGTALLWLRRYPEAREAIDQGLALTPLDPQLIATKSNTFLADGDLAGARAVLSAVPEAIAQDVLVAQAANSWALDPQQQEHFLRLTPSAFDDDRGDWAISLAGANALRGDPANARTYAKEARKAYEEQLRAAPEDPFRRVFLGLSLAYLGRKQEAIREGERGAALAPMTKNVRTGAFLRHQLVRIYMLVGEPEKALDQLEPLLKIPYYLSPGWLKIDPNFDPLRKNPRFQKLVAGAK
jgi:TolB-like protein/Tfp pilus assembly protein PilF